MALFDYLKPQYMVDPDFPILVSFPRTGSHWLRLIMELYLEEPALVRTFFYHDPKSFWGLHTHDINLKVKNRNNIIYLYREPVNTIYSEMVMNNKKFNTNIDHYIELYSNHLIRWLYHNNDTKKIITLTYEDMKRDIFSEVSKVIKFLNKPFDKQKLKNCCEQIDKQKVKEKTQHDLGVINQSPNYEECRKMFREKFGQYIFDQFVKKDVRLVWPECQPKTYYFMGDSHVNIFNTMAKNNMFDDNISIKTKIVQGATAQGMVNPASKTNALNILNDFIDTNILDKKTKLFFLLGEVDCGFVIWYRAEKHGITIEEQLHTSIDNYFTFLKNTKNKGYNDINVISVSLPTIVDNYDWRDHISFRSEVTANQKARTDLTLHYNKLLEEKCKEHNFNFIDITAEQLDKKTGIIKPKFLNSQKWNHHLKDDEISKIIRTKIK